MTVIACFEAVVLVAIVFLMLRHQAKSERAWTEERRELLTRIQRPELVPTARAEPFVFPEPEPDELNLVGAILEPKEED